MRRSRLFLAFLLVGLVFPPTLSADCAATFVDTGVRIPVGVQPLRLILTPDGTELYVSNYTTATVSVIDPATNAVTHTIPVVGGVGSLAVHPDGSKVYAGGHFGGVSVIDTATKAVTNAGTLGGPVRELAITPNGARVYLAMEWGGLRVLNTATNGVSTASTYVCPEGVAVTPDGSTAYVSYQCGGPGGWGGHDAIGRFHAATGAYLGSITGQPNVGQTMTMSPDGLQVWGNGGNACDGGYDGIGCPYKPSGLVNAFSTTTNTLLQSIAFAGFSPGAISFTPDSAYALINSYPSSTLVFDRNTFGIVQTIPLYTSGSFAFLGTHAWAPLPYTNEIAVFDYGCPNAPPVADAGADQTLECTGATTTVTLDGSGSSDPDGDALAYEWYAGATLVASGATAAIELPNGTHALRLVVTDPAGETDDDEVSIAIGDTTAPSITGAATSVSTLWPPNHKMVDVDVSYATSDACSFATTSLSVASNEPGNGLGDGDAAPDFEVVNGHRVRLRAERSGTGEGRVYTITITATDAAGNASTATVDVTVPKSR